LQNYEPEEIERLPDNGLMKGYLAYVSKEEKAQY
jgi:hypothetical protein